jgi:uncharacterized protein DUF1707/2TM domain-containing protein
MSKQTAPEDANLRASDAERERQADRLREHAAEGRITIEELEERLDRVYSARTGGELDQVLQDLPRVRLPAERHRRQARRRKDFHAHLAPYVMVNLLLVVIWALTGAGYFWPIWPLLGWGVGLAAHAMEAFSPACRKSGQRRVTPSRV